MHDGGSEMQEKKKIVLGCDTKKELRKYGRVGSSYDDVVRDLLSHVNTCDSFWENRF